METKLKITDSETDVAEKKRCPPTRVWRWIRTNLLLVLTILGVICGVGLGFLVRLCEPSPDTIMYVSFPGDILLRILKCLVLPLIMTSIITGSASADVRTSGHIAIRTVIYFLSTSVLATLVGVVMVTVIHPGRNNGAVVNVVGETQKLPTAVDTILDLFRNLFPPNILQAFFQSVGTIYVRADEMETIEHNTTKTMVSMNTTYYASYNSTERPQDTVEDRWKRKIVTSDRSNVLGVIMFCIVFGIIMSKLGKKAKALFDFFNALNLVIGQFVKVVLWYCPLGLMFLIAGTILKIEDPEKIGRQLVLFTVTAISALLIHCSVVLPGIYFILTRKNPYKIFPRILQALITAFGTSSSAATLPVTLKCLEENIGIEPRVTKFVLPIGCTINMDGTAVFMTMACIFIAQRNNIVLTVGRILKICLTGLSISVGAAAVPGIGPLVLIWAITAAGLPVEDVTFMFAIDWFLERVRTVVNVAGDCFGTATIAHLLRHKLAKEIPKNCDEETGHVRAAGELEETDSLPDETSHML